MEQYIDEYLRNIFGETLLEDEREGRSSSLLDGAKEVTKVPEVKTTRIIEAAALGAGYIARRKYAAAAERACAQYSSTRKAACIQKYRAGGIKAEVLSLKENCIICLEAPDKELCLEFVKLRILELRQEIKKLT